MSLNACGSIHQGHDWGILVMTLEEDKGFLCVWLLYYVSNFCRFANGAKTSMKSFFMEFIFFSVHSAAVFLSFRQKYFLSQ